MRMEISISFQNIRTGSNSGDTWESKYGFMHSAPNGQEWSVTTPTELPQFMLLLILLIS
jgi:hypothetical protein